MTETLSYQTLRSCDAARFGRIGAGLLAQVERDRQPRLVVAELTGDCILLGRHQRASSALDRERASSEQVARRLGGGRAIRAGDGSVGVYLALPEIGSLLIAKAPAGKLINRYVRGLNQGLTLAGAGNGAHYFGRDFVSADGKQIAVVSQDGAPSGAAIFEAVVAVEKPFTLPEGMRGYPQHGDPRADGPPPGTLAELWSSPHAFEKIAQSIAAGYGKAFGCEIRDDSPAAIPEGELLPPAWEDEEGLEDSGVADIPIGFAEALVRPPLEPVTDVRLRGDFIAPAFAIRELERALVGRSLDFIEIGRAVDEAFRQPHAGILGVTAMRVFADAVLAASGRL